MQLGEEDGSWEGRKGISRAGGMGMGRVRVGEREPTSDRNAYLKC